ncbi:MAG: DUF4124 domain-containing protein [Halioglobus sp.]
MRRLLVVALLLLPLAGLAQSIYRSTDAQGNVVFTDTPPPGGTTTDRVEVQRINTVQPPPQITQPSTTNETDTTTAEEKQPAYTVTIVAPENETSFPMGPGNFSVMVSVSPALRKYEGLQLFMDGTPWGTPQLDTMWDLTNVFRGRHDITVGVVDKSGETLAISPPVRVFVHRPSVNFNR